ncbi:AraC family transcriptional regulator [Methylotenera versatilis]|uniref:AraC family transcriptional regulator n=1 Tax=Methylotenera versatilis TaxID=1055487 RepID=UPI0006471623|nr:AraC family transcriptional regulator [Methylotenera versatilis]
MTCQQSMIDLLLKLAPNEGYTLSILDGVKLMRSNRYIPRMPVLYEPCIVVVLQGRKMGYLGNQAFQYCPQQFLVLSLPLPFESETFGTAERPMLAISIRINLAVVAELVLSLDSNNLQSELPQLGMVSTAVDDKLSDAVIRLLEVLASPQECEILGPSIMREIYYRVLTGKQGAAIRETLMHQSHFSKIGKALKRIHADFAGELDVATLAKEANMSVAAFHANFKALTATSPMQYLKTARLHKARLHMMQDGMSASTASRKVGYESISQFSREFKRFFGRTPMNEVAEMKHSLIEMPSENSAKYVTVN